MISTSSSSSSWGVMVFTVAWVPTGIKIGVSTTPWGVSRRPRRALLPLHSCVTVKRTATKLLPSQKQHAVPKTKKAVALGNGMVIGTENSFPVCEGADQHEQGGFGQMEIGNQGIYHLKPISGVDKDISPTGTSVHLTPFIGQGFQHPYGSCAHGNHPAARPPAVVDHGDALRAQFKELLVHHVLLNLRRLHRPEGPQPHMEREGHHRHTQLLNLRQQ